MGRITQVTCDSCKKDITNKAYQTLTIRRYGGQNHEKMVRIPALWLCDKCYRKMALTMAFPPYDGEEGE